MLPSSLAWLASYYLPAGIAIGYVAAAPIGPVNVMAIQRSLRHGRRSALLVGGGAAVGDALFAGLAILGVTVLTELLAVHRDVFRFLGGALLIIFALFLWRSHASLDAARHPRTHHLSLAAFVMTVTNPATFLWFAGAFSAVGFRDVGSGDAQALLNSAKLVAGVLLGSMLWWATIAQLASSLRGRLNQAMLDRINHGAAIVLLLFGIGGVIAGLSR